MILYRSEDREHDRQRRLKIKPKAQMSARTLEQIFPITKEYLFHKLVDQVA
jgi:hypothetical protein